MVVPVEQLSYKATGSTTARLLGDRAAEIINVKDYGALGDGSHNDTANIQAAFDAAYGTSGSPHGSTNATSNHAVFFPPGEYIVSGNPALTLTNIQGAHIFGSGRFTTKISHVTSGGVLLETDGFEYSKIELIWFHGVGGVGSRGLNLNHHTFGYRNVQSNSLEDLYIDVFEIGINIASSQDGQGSYGQGSEILIKNCYFQLCSLRAIAVNNANALSVTMIGGNIAGCGIGAHILSGSMFFYAVAFQAQTTCDIQTEQSGFNTLVVSACRSESANFINNQGNTTAIVEGCTHTSPGTNGYFLRQLGSRLEISSCESVYGDVELTQSIMASIRTSHFNRSDWLALSSLWYTANGFGNTTFANIDIENVGNGVTNWGQIVNQRIYLNDAGTTITRSYNIETAALTDQVAIYASGWLPVDISAASPGVVRYPNSPASEQFIGLVANDQVVFGNTGGAVPTGLTAGTRYFVKTVVTPGTFTVSATAGGAAINTSGGSGSQFMARPRVYAVGDIIWQSAPAAGGSPGWVCTTAGVLATGGTAVFKAIANIAA